MKKLYGTGINDADYQVTTKGLNGKRVHCPYYMRWSNMLKRCYNSSYISTHMAYLDTHVSNEWLLFSNFKAWMETQDWEGKQLDKDLLIQSNRVYSAESCIFVGNDVNMLFTDTFAKRGEYPLGVCKCKRDDNYISRISVQGKGKFLGRFEKINSAHTAWQRAKKEAIYNVAIKQEDTRLKAALLSRCTQLQHDIDNNLETKKL